jgi:hypothetical protein
VTTSVVFNPSPRQPFQFLATLDDAAYNVTVKWNVSGQRWYVFVDGPDGTNVVTLPLVGSPPGYDISLVAGYFTSTLVYRTSSETFEVSP